MNKIIIFETIVFICIASVFHYLIQRFFSNKKFLILNGIIWGFIVATSFLINKNYYIYFASLSGIGTLVVTIYLIKFLNREILNIDLHSNIVFWLMFSISSITIIGLIITKYLVYNSFNYRGPTGDKGDTGKIGDKGVEYDVNTIPEKCYNEIINYAEGYIKSIKDANNVEYDDKEEQLKNLYIKENIKRICFSYGFLKDIYNGNKNMEGVCKQTDEDKFERRCDGGIYDDYKCMTDNDCSSSATIFVYDQKIKEINSNLDDKIKEFKKEIKLWLNDILTNDYKENDILKKRLKVGSHESLDDVLGDAESISDLKTTSTLQNVLISFNDKGKYRNDLRRFNSEYGKRFLGDYFMNDEYWAKNFKVKLYDNNDENGKDCKYNNYYNPFDRIKQYPFWKNYKLREIITKCSS